MTAPRAHEAISVVFKAPFNPLTFTPRWFEETELFSASELQDIDVEVIAPEAAILSIGWLRFRSDALTVELVASEVDRFYPLRDVALGVLRALEGVPVASLGINRGVHFSVPDEHHWHAIGDALSPKEIWGDALHLAGTRSATVWSYRSDRFGGQFQVQVEPSQMAQGVFVGTNDHYLLDDVEPFESRSDLNRIAPPDPEPALFKRPRAFEVLNDYWDDSLRRTEDVVEIVAKLGVSG